MSQPLICDGNNLVMRSVMASAVGDLRAGKLWTGGIYGALSSLGAITAKLESLGRAPSVIIMFFDSGWPDERAALLPGYKSDRANRKELMSEEDMAAAKQQLTACAEMFPLLGVQVMCFAKREADDCIGGMVKLLVASGCEPTVLSGDKDLFQTVGMGAVVWYLSQDPYLLTKDNFRAKVGVPWESYLLYKALKGDNSDSIAGVPGVGDMRAAELIEESYAQVDAESNGGFGFADYDLHGQLDALVELVARSPEKNRPKFKQNLLVHAERLHSVLDGICLEDSFGPLEPLDALFDGSVPITPFDQPAILAYVAKLKFNSVAMNPRTYLSPFERAWDRFAVALQV